MNKQTSLNKVLNKFWQIFRVIKHICLVCNIRGGEVCTKTDTYYKCNILEP